jgi:NADH-quinone oxidoreductase subunit F
MEKIITKNFDVPQMYRLEVAKKHGAYSTLPRLFDSKPRQVVEEVKRSGLRGRGGAGFPTGDKWSFVPRDVEGPVYLVVNADESEPGAFKDRSILESDPHLLIEGIIIAAYAIGANIVFVYFRGEYVKQWRRFLAAVDEARGAGLIGQNIGGSSSHCQVVPHRGAGAYVCGEETALLNSIEGSRGSPRIRPPFPASQGLFGRPTVVSNVETLASLPFIIREGAQAFRNIGTDASPGTKLISVCGHVERPGVYEIEMGMPLASFLADCAGGTLAGRRLKAVIPGGVSAPVLTDKEALGAHLDFESLAARGSQLGCGGMIVMDDSACMVRMLADITRFFAHESCGRCSPCREGSGWIRNIVNNIENGREGERDPDLLLDISGGMAGCTICAMADGLAAATSSFVTKFRDEFWQHIKQGSCPFLD